MRGELLGDAWWSDFLLAISQSDEDGKNVQTRLAQHLDDTPAYTLDYWEWLHLAKVFFKFGLFYLGYKVRLKARESAIIAIQNKIISPDNLAFQGAVPALIEAGEWSLFRTVIKQADALSEQEKDSFLFWERLAHGLSLSADLYESKTLAQEDKAFAEFVKNKQIAFVGPSKSEIRSAAEIDSFDLVARCNYKESGVGVDPEIKGSRCDISYFNNTETRSMCESKQNMLPESIRFAVFRSYSSLRSFRKRFQQELNWLLKKTTTRLAVNRSLSLFSGSLNGIPNALSDLLRFNPDQIKIFHADLMLTVDRFSGYNNTSMSIQSIQVFINSCSGTHDPVTQYVILKLMHQTGKVIGDEGFERLMAMGEVAYMQALQRTYGNFARVAPASTEKLSSP